jgi:hypothetical protein
VEAEVLNTLAVVDVERRALRQARFITDGMVVSGVTVGDDRPSVENEMSKVVYLYRRSGQISSEEVTAH